MRTVAFTSELRANFEMCLVHGTFIYQCAVLQEVPANEGFVAVLGKIGHYGLYREIFILTG